MDMNEKALYYKCALQVNSYNYTKYRGNTPTDELAYNKEILEKCKANGISVVGIADHCYTDESERLRKYLSDNNVVVFPGFEISTAEKIHIVCLFSPMVTSSELNRILGNMGFIDADQESEVSEKTCLEIADQIEKNKGFWYAAHITGDNGILKLGKNQHIWTSKKLIAAQIPDSKDNIDPAYANIIRNKDPQYKREERVAYINASDVEKPEDLDKENTSVLIKMSEPNFENFRMAFKDAESRIRLNSEKENNYQSSIDSITITGGYLDGFTTGISENLTTIIGGRGTGKSTLINIIRYALDKQPIGKNATNDFKEMIGENLGSTSKVELMVTSNAQYGQKYVVTRRYNQSPVITDMEGNVLALKIDDILPTIEIYGQNEIMEIVLDKSQVCEVAARLFNIEKQIMDELNDAHAELQKNGLELNKLEKQYDKNETQLDEMPAVKNQLAFYQKAGIDSKLEVVKRISTEEGQFEVIKQALPTEELTIAEMVVGDYKNEELKALKVNVEEYNSEIKKIIAQYGLAKEKVIAAFMKHKEAWNTSKEKYDDQLKHSLKEINNIQDKTSKEIGDEYGELIKKVEASKPLEERRNAIKLQKADMTSQRQTLIEKYKRCCDKRDEVLNRNLKLINKRKLNGIVRLTILPRQNITDIINKLCSLQGIGERTISGISNYQDFDTFTFTEDVRQGIDNLKSKYSLTANIAEKICRGLSRADLREIEDMELEDIVVIELNVDGKFKPLKALSKGQQCTAVLNLLLLENKDPLIIDQPEDNLDNSFIAENLVKTLRENKIKRQYILATHNANIPVFGDAEQIITMEEEQGAGRIAENGLGSIDSPQVKEKVINILEGGKTAFKMREAKYGI